MNSTASAHHQTHNTLWRTRLGCALRTVLACTIVGCTTLYGPEPLQRLLSYSAFSYVTTILIVSEATLGGTLRGFWLVVYAAVQVLIPSMLSLWLIGPARFTNALAAVAVALSAFVAALPESTPLLCKRLAFGQTVIVYVGTVVYGAQTRPFMHPIHVASSTALGALASVLATLFPFPRLAHWEVKRACSLYTENASKRLCLIVEALSTHDTSTAAATRELIAQEKCLSKTGLELLQIVRDNQGGMAWERPSIKLLKSSLKDLGEKLQEVEVPLRGMQIALLFSPELLHIGMIDKEWEQVLQMSKERIIGLKLKNIAKCIESSEGESEISEKRPSPAKSTTTSFSIPKNPAALFILYCMEFLQGDPPTIPNSDNTPKKTEESNGTSNSFQRPLNNLIIRPPSSSRQKLVFAFKCSISLGFATLFGLMYDKTNGYWSGLMIAISFVTGRHAIFTLANDRAQGTAMGSIYGVLCSFLFPRFLELRFLLLLPWIIFTSFLIHSKTYGQAGAFSAAIGALLILGRRDYGSPTEFAIARITEATIGLICFILVELLFNHSRAATLAKSQLSQSMRVFRYCVENIVICSSKENALASSGRLREKLHELKYHVKELETFIAEAEMEPNFWFVPFNGSCYHKLLRSFSTLVNLLHFVAYKIEFISEASQQLEDDLEEQLKQVNYDIELFRRRVGSSLRCLEEEASSATTLQVALKKDFQVENLSCNIENAFWHLVGDDEDAEDILIRHLEEFIDKIYSRDCGVADNLKRQMALCLGGLVFCIHSFAREAKDIEKEVKELIKWENPSTMH
ncbi:P-hydroxybenzoic acid efflux pump subunit [Parasponia andersonii]|uniref:p-hydroxybenzoic acid efflux pump subunit n=1 Tax=Parasponia andersonii TaxID=3476 RepID=A0A2P5B6Z2_PARAD|nr:P-hydroxybenzoic acid efflux pump subunit [Parasponia andersonii]